MLRRSKIKARPIIKKSQAKPRPQNPKPSEPDLVSSQPESDPVKAIKISDDMPALSTSIPNENPMTNVRKTTGEEAVSDHHAACKSQQGKVTPSSSCMILSGNHSASEPQHDEGSAMPEPDPTDIAVCNSTKEASREMNSNVDVNQPAVEVNMQESPLPIATTITTVSTIDDAPEPGPADIAVCNSAKKASREMNSNVNVNQPAVEVNTQESPLHIATTVTTVSTIDDVPTENKKNIENKKSTIPGGRRRKIMACPTAGKKRRKTDVKSEGAKHNKNVDASTLLSDRPSSLASALPDSETSMAIALPKNVESTDMVTLDLERCDVPVESSEDVVSVDVAALTTVNEVPQSKIDESPTFGINSSNNDKLMIEDTPTALVDNSICESEQVALTNSHSVQLLEDELKIPHPKKCIVKIKTKSLSNKYRTKAMEKLNRLKENQSDRSEWPELDQNYVSMSDLIFLNPPAKVGHKLGMNADQEQSTESVIQSPVATTETPETVEDTTNNKPLPVPQIRIAEDGTVVVDEESLVLDTQKPQDPTIHTVYESGRDTCINQRSFMRRSFAKGIRWTVEETNEFYRCLRIVGAEFSLMSAMFQGRSPDDLRRKFRREHKNNPVRVDQALMQQHLSKWTDDMFKAKEPNSSSILKPPSETPMQS